LIKIKLPDIKNTKRETQYCTSTSFFLIY